ncbi:MAG: hypothetical protein AB7N99_02620 [Simkaniaceae bacterium]|nr:hypothetical protein [Chlamydiia bacterium]
MKKYLTIALLAFASLTFANEKEKRGQDLCQFTESVFGILQDESRLIDEEKLENAYLSFIERLKQYEKDPNPEIAEMAEKFILSFKEGADTKEALADAVSALGRLLKCSVDDEYYRIDTAYMLHREDLQKQIAQIEAKLEERLPKGYINYHKLMIESLAEEEYDLALYAYLKIAESRCE